MKKFNITVNGNTYQVEVEEVKDGNAAAPVPAVKPAAPAPAPAAPAPAPAAKPAAPAHAPAGGNTVTAPMPGTILDVKVKEGDSVKNGDVLVVLEAMKMENEIFAPADGTVASVNVSKGASVNAGDVLVSLK
ncbi:MAG: biotin/lipoyl-binding protein [Clostridiales bacterium]|nr:biotin/lipoyl-binding protein [Clostridiales bacterium]